MQELTWHFTLFFFQRACVPVRRFTATPLRRYVGTRGRRGGFSESEWKLRRLVPVYHDRLMLMRMMMLMLMLMLLLM